MHKKDWTVKGPVEVRLYDGQISIFDTLEEAVGFYHHLCGSVKYGYLRSHDWYLAFRGDSIEIRDELGFRIPPWKIREVWETIPEPRRWWNRSRRFKFREGPVESIRCWRGGKGGWRRPRTRQELRENTFLVDYSDEIREYKFKVRRKRCHGGRDGLPSCWDDLNRTRQRSWKEHRRHQWKE